MPENKKHHYVPKFYLKHFSNNGNNSHLSLYNFKNKKFIPHADIRNQAYEDFFYGKDNEIEKALGLLESDVKVILDKLNPTNELPKPPSNEYTNLHLFMLFQAERTVQAVEKLNEGLDKLLETLSPEEDKGKYELRLDNPTLLIFQTVVDTLHVTTDLACKLIINKSDIPFITSDNPVVKYNQFLEKRGKTSGITGLGTKGLQIFYPINPQKMLLFYDSRVYKIGVKKKSMIETKDKTDIDNLNLLQALNCSEQIFFNNRITEWYIDNLIEKRKRFYKATRSILIEHPGTKQPDGSYSEIAQITSHALNTQLKLSFIKETDHAKQYKLTDWVVELRDERLRHPDKFKIPTIYDFIDNSKK